MSVARVAREERGAQPLAARVIHRVLGVEPEDLRVPPMRPLGVSHEDVDVVEGHRLVAHRSLSQGSNGVTGEYSRLGQRGGRRSHREDGRDRRDSPRDSMRFATPHFIGENAVGRRIVVVTCCTMGPFFSLSANTRARSGSLAKPSNFATRSSRLSQASM